MPDIWKTIAKLASDLHPDRILAIAKGVESLDTLEDLYIAKRHFGPNAGTEAYRCLNDAWSKNSDIKGKEIAAALKGAAATVNAQSENGVIEFVLLFKSGAKIIISICIIGINR